MDVHVVIATKGRATSLVHLLDALGKQTLTPTTITFVGSCADDVSTVSEQTAPDKCQTRVLVAPAGLCIQRNHGLEHVRRWARSQARTKFVVVFFDDDFRPAADWLENATNAFQTAPDLAAITGWVLADGVYGTPITEVESSEFLSGTRAPAKHWASGETPRELGSMYGCNMAFRDRVVMQSNFDENLPLYGWQEDRDYTARARKFGRTAYEPLCRGVHLGSRSGRTSGVRLGYSQVANPVYLWRKGTMSASIGARFVTRNLLANCVRSVRNNRSIDYVGRLRGNLMAFADLARGSCHPTRVVGLS